MAWNVVIAGGGFAGATARPPARADAAEAVGAARPRQRRQLHALHAVPARGGGRARSSRATSSRRCATSSSAPTCASARSPATTPARAPSSCTSHEGEVEELRYDQFLVALGSVSRSLPVPGLDQHAIGFKSLADAIWLRNHVIETLEAANATEDPQRREELLTYVFVGGGYAGLEALAELQDFAADAMDRYPRARLHGMRWILVEAARPGAARDRRRTWPTTRFASCAAAASTSGSAPAWRRSAPTERALSTGEVIPTRTMRLDHRRRAAPEPARRSRLPLERARPGADRREPARRGPATASGRSATAPRCPTRPAASAADGPARRSARAGGRPEHRRRARRRRARGPSRTRTGARS